MKNPKVMAVQMEILPFNYKENFFKIKKFIEIAGSNSCDFIAFPEKCDGILSPDKYIDKEHKKFLNSVRKACKENKVYCILGSTLKKALREFYNVSYLIGKKGEIIGKYRKISVTHYGELFHTKGGDNLPVFDTEFGKVGILICRDILYQELFNELRKKDAKIIFCPSFWSWYSLLYERDIPLQKTYAAVGSDIVALRALAQSRAIENELFFIFVNAGEVYQFFPKNKKQK